jgi:hypothetical protein
MNNFSKLFKIANNVIQKCHFISSASHKNIENQRTNLKQIRINKNKKTIGREREICYSKLWENEQARSGEET